MHNIETKLINTYSDFSEKEFYKELKLNEELGKLQKLDEEFVNYKFKIAVVGEFNTGKSSLINSLIGTNILPEGIIPTTNQIVIIENSINEEYIVKGNDRLDLTTETVKTANKSDENFKIYTKFKQMEDFVFIDTAGTNDPSRLSSEVVFDLIGNVDIVLFLTSAFQPLKATEIKFLLKLVRKKDIEKFFFIINKEDLKTDVEKIEIRDYILDTLSKEFQENKEELKKQIFLYSAKNAQKDIENSKKLVENINEFTKNKCDELLKDLRNRKIKEILGNSFNKIDYLIETLDGRSKEYENDLNKINNEIESFKEKIAEKINNFNGDFASNKRKYIKNVEQSFESVKTIIENEINNTKIEELSSNRYVELRTRKLIEDYLTEDSKKFIETLDKNIETLDKDIKPIFDETKIVIKDLSIKTNSSLIVKTLAGIGVGAVAISYAPTALTIGGIGATLVAGATAAGAAFPAFLPFSVLIAGFVTTLGKTIYDVGKLFFTLGKWGIKGTSDLVDKAELIHKKKEYISSVKESISNIEKSTIRDIKDSFHPEYYVESFISDKFPEKNELEEKINLSKQNVFLEMDKLNSEKNEIDGFIKQCTYILNQGLTK